MYGGGDTAGWRAELSPCQLKIEHYLQVFAAGLHPVTLLLSARTHESWRKHDVGHVLLSDEGLLLWCLWLRCKVKAESCPDGVLHSATLLLKGFLCSETGVRGNLASFTLLFFFFFFFQLVSVFVQHSGATREKSEPGDANPFLMLIKFYYPKKGLFEQ